MEATNLYIALVVGTVISLVFTEATGFAPGGLIVPGYLALIFDQPKFLLTVAFISLLTYIIVVYGIGRITILYGRRKFVAMLVVAIVLKTLLDYVYPIMPYEILGLRGIGVIVPALIANGIQKQGWATTIGSTAVLSGITFLTMYTVRMV